MPAQCFQGYRLQWPVKSKTGALLRWARQKVRKICKNWIFHLNINVRPLIEKDPTPPQTSKALSSQSLSFLAPLPCISNWILRSSGIQANTLHDHYFAVQSEYGYLTKRCIIGLMSNKWKQTLNLAWNSNALFSKSLLFFNVNAFISCTFLPT